MPLTWQRGAWPAVYTKYASAGAWSEVLEPDHPLDHLLDLPLGSRERQPFEAVLRIGIGLGTEALLELCQGDRPSGITHVVVTAARFACVLDREALDEIAGPILRQLLVHRPSEVIGVDSLDHHYGRRRPTLHPCKPDAAALPQPPSHGLELLTRVPMLQAANRKPVGLVLHSRPASSCLL